MSIQKFGAAALAMVLAAYLLTACAPANAPVPPETTEPPTEVTAPSTEPQETRPDPLTQEAVIAGLFEGVETGESAVVEAPDLGMQPPLDALQDDCCLYLFYKDTAELQSIITLKENGMPLGEIASEADAKALAVDFVLRAAPDFGPDYDIFCTLSTPEGPYNVELKAKLDEDFYGDCLSVMLNPNGTLKMFVRRSVDLPENFTPEGNWISREEALEAAYAAIRDFDNGGNGNHHRYHIDDQETHTVTACKEICDGIVCWRVQVVMPTDDDLECGFNVVLDAETAQILSLDPCR